MKPIGTIAILFAILVCMWSAQAQRMTQIQNVAPVDQRADLAPELIDQIKSGMTLEEVCETVNASPFEINLFEGKVRKHRSACMAWFKGKEGRSLGVLLKSGAVVSIISSH